MVFAPDLEEIYPSYAGREIRVGIDPVIGSAARYEGRSRAASYLYLFNYEQRFKS